MNDARLRALVAGLFLLGVLGGSRLDTAPESPPTMRCGYRVLEADFHAHTRFSDGLLSPFDLVLQARRRGLDAFAITEHNTVLAGKVGRWFSRLIGGPAVLVGEEITTNRFHLIGVGLQETVRAGEPLRASLDAIHAQGGVAIAAHPVRRYWERFESEIDRLDASEVMHPLAYRGGSVDWRWSEMRDFFVRARANGKNLTAIGSSDYHGLSVLGVTRTLVFVPDDRGGDGDVGAAVLDALKKGRTVVYDRQGEAYGDPALAACLHEQPYTPREQDYGYRGSGLLDRIARLLGWIGLVGCVLWLPRAGGAPLDAGGARADEDA